MRRVSRRSRPGAAWLLALALAAAVAHPAREATAQAPPPDAAPAESPPVVEAVPLAEVVAEAEKTANRVRAIRSGLGEEPAFAKIEADLPETERATAALDASTRTTLETRPPLRMLVKLDGQWRAATQPLSGWESDLTGRATRLQDWQAELEALQERWQKTRSQAREARAPAEVIARIDGEVERIRETAKLVSERLQRLLALQSRVGDQRQRAADAEAAIQKARSETVTTVFEAGQAPVWDEEFRRDLRRELTQGLGESFDSELARIREYLDENPERLPLQAAFFAIASLALVLWRRRLRQRPADEELRSGPLAPIFELPFSAALLIALLLGRVLYSTGPPSFAQLVLAVALVPTVRILRRFLDPHLHLGLYTVFALYLVGLVSDLSESLPALERSILIFQVLAGISLLGWLMRPSRLRRIPPQLLRSPQLRVLGVAARITLLGFALVLFATGLGFARLGELVGDGILRSAYAALVITALVRVGQGLSVLALRVRPLSLLGMVRQHRALFERRARELLLVGGVIWWTSIALSNFAIRDPVLAAVGAVLTAELAFGSVRLSLAGVLGFGVTIWLAFALSRFVRFVLDEDVYPRARLARGRPYAISTMVHYAMLFLGFILAVAASGISLDRVTLMLGAFGVGIGFGLQNVVNNFVSGLILLFERPVHIGDVVQVGQLWGEVRRIGIRASVVRTFDGAEVIVPNGQLTSEQVTNWTLSDRTRRLHLRIGVEYGTDPERVLEILRQVAARHPDVLETPPPLALFLEHGESSLDFELRVWTREFDRGLSVRSELTVAVNRALAEAGISVPFPQRDLHLRSAAPELRDLGRGAESGSER
jgi:potassium efflux system protein